MANNANMQSVRLLIGPDVDTNELVSSMTEVADQTVEESNNTGDKDAKFDDERQNQLISEANAVSFLCKIFKMI